MASSVNRFFGIRGDVSTQLAPWVLVAMGFKPRQALFELGPTLRMRSDIAGGVLVVPTGTISDLASIPQFAWSIFMAPDDPRIALVAWFHDQIYKNCGKLTLEDGRNVTLTRKQADQILAHEGMTDLYASAAQRFIVYQILRRFGDGWPGDPFTE